MNFALNRYKTILLRKVFLLGLFALLGFASVSNSLYASTEEQQRREARVQATYLIHLINFTRWSEAHLPEAGKAPEILVIGDETNGLVASLRYLIAESKVKIGGSRANFLHFTNAQSESARRKLEQGSQVVLLLPNAMFAPSEIRKISPSAVLFGFGPDFVTKAGGDVSFISSRNRVKLTLSETYFRRTSPKLSSKIANLKSVVVIIPSNRSS